MHFRRKDPIDEIQWEMVTKPRPTTAGLPRSQSQPVLSSAPLLQPPPSSETAPTSLTTSVGKLRKLRGIEDLRKGNKKPNGQGDGEEASRTLAPTSTSHPTPPGLPRAYSSNALTSLLPKDPGGDEVESILLSLSSQLRERIWHYALEVVDGILVCRCRSCLIKPNFVQPALTRVSRRLRKETLRIFYSSNRFHVKEVYRGDYAPLWIRTLKPSIREFLTHVQLTTDQPDMTIAAMKMYGMHVKDMFPIASPGSDAIIIFCGKDSQDRKRRSKRYSREKKPHLEMVDEAEEILQEQESEDHGLARVQRDSKANKNAPPASDTLTSNTRFEKEPDSVQSDKHLDTWWKQPALKNISEQPEKLRSPKKSHGSPRNRSRNRKMFILNGNLTDEQLNHKINVQQAMSQFDFSFAHESPKKTDPVESRPPSLSKSSHENDLSALERYYVPHYFLEDAVPEKKRELRHNSPLEEEISTDGQIAGQDETAYHLTEEGRWRQRGGQDTDDSVSTRMLKRMSLGSTDRFSSIKSSKSRRSSRYGSSADGEDEAGRKKLNRTMSSAGWGAYKVLTLGLG